MPQQWYYFKELSLKCEIESTKTSGCVNEQKLGFFSYTDCINKWAKDKHNVQVVVKKPVVIRIK